MKNAHEAPARIMRRTARSSLLELFCFPDFLSCMSIFYQTERSKSTERLNWYDVYGSVINIVIFKEQGIWNSSRTK